jgi:DNA polymerase-4
LFVDVTGTGRLFGPPTDVAWRLRRQAWEALRLAPVWAVAPNKLVAKVATRLVKPEGEYVVAPGGEATFLAPLPLGLLPGIERDDLLRLGDFNLARAGQVAALGVAALQVPFGKRAQHLYEIVRGIDPSPVRPADTPPPQVTVDHTFDEDAYTPAVLEAALYTLAEDVGRELRQRRLTARRVVVRLGFSDGLIRIRQRRLCPATANDPALFAGARSAFYLAWKRRVRIRNMGLLADGLTFPPAQQALFPEARTAVRQGAQLVAALDGIRDRFGAEAIRVGRTLAA